MSYGSEILGSQGGDYENGQLSSGLLRRVVWYKFTDVSEMLASFMIRQSRLIERQ
jgi:hypothetical protein